MPEPSRAVARYDGPRTVDDLERYSRTLAVNVAPDGRSWRNDALPATFRGNPAAVAFAVEYAKALDVSPVTALIGIHIVDGKPTASSGLISALVRRAGHKIRTYLEGSIDEGNAKAVTTIHRADDPEFEYRSEWTLSRAVRAGLMRRTDDGRIVAVKSKSAWDTYPENMLKARSITECARDAAEDAVLGVHYTPEELGVDVDESGEPVYTVTQVPVQEQRGTAGNESRGPVTGEDEAGRDRATPPPSSTPAGGETSSPPPAAPDEEDRGKLCRTWILKATTREELAAGWSGTPGLSVDEATTLATYDEGGAETTVLDLFRRQTAAIDAGNPLVDLCHGDDDEGGTPATPDPTPEPDTDGNGREIVDAVVVEDETPVHRAQREVGEKLEQQRQERIEHRDNGGPPPSSGPAVAPSETPNVDDVVTLAKRLTVEQWADVESWARLNGIDPTKRPDEETARILLDAITSGDAFSTPNRPADPVALVAEILGGVVVEETRTTPAEQHTRELEERRAEAAAATPAHTGPPPKGAGKVGYQEARRAARAAADKEGDKA